jgi:hypothetical protein
MNKSFFNIDKLGNEFCISLITFYEPTPEEFYLTGGKNTLILGIFNSLPNAINGIKNNELYKNQKIMFNNKEVV